MMNASNRTGVVVLLVVALLTIFVCSGSAGAINVRLGIYVAIAGVVLLVGFSVCSLVGRLLLQCLRQDSSVYRENDK